jgi:hypothetical protein
VVFVFCLSSTHSCAPSAYTLAYPTVLTIVHLDGTSILSLYSTILFLFSLTIYLIVLKLKKCQCLIFVSSCSVTGCLVNISKSCCLVVKVIAVVLTFDWGKQLKSSLLQNIVYKLFIKII